MVPKVARRVILDCAPRYGVRHTSYDIIITLTLVHTQSHWCEIRQISPIVGPKCRHMAALDFCRACVLIGCLQNVTPTHEILHYVHYATCYAQYIRATCHYVPDVHLIYTHV